MAHLQHPSFRILHIAPGEPFGGVQRIVPNLAEVQSQNDRAAVLWTGESAGARAQMHTTGVETLQAEGSIPARIRAVRETIAAFRPDVIHLHMPPPWILFALPRGHEAIIYHLHGAPIAQRGLKGILASLLDRRVIAKASVLIAISEWIEREWRKQIPVAHYRCVANGIPVAEDFAPIRAINATNPPVIGFASRLAPDKGVSEFATFILAMHEKWPDARFHIAGEGPERSLLEQRLRAPLDRGLVRLMGHVADMNSFWRELDLAIFSAPGEPFGLRLIEPVALGVPVIAYETGAGSDEIARACAGIATVPYADAAAMADLAGELLSDHARREGMAKAGKEDVIRHFSIEAMAAGIGDVYREVLGGHSGAAA